MFENLKKKLKNAISKISGQIEEPAQEQKQGIPQAPEKIEEKLEKVEQEIVQDAQAEAKAEQVVEETEKAAAAEPVADQVLEKDVEQVIETSLSREAPEQEIELEKETEKEIELERELLADEKAEAKAEKIIEEIKEAPKSKKEKKAEKKAEKVIEKALEKTPAEAEIKEAKAEAWGVIDLTEDEQEILKEAEKEAEVEFQRHTEILKEEGEGFFKKLFGKKKKEGAQEHRGTGAQKDRKEEEPKKKLEEIKPTLLERLRNKKISEDELGTILWDLELALLENDVAKEVTEKITADIKKELAGSETSHQSVEKIITGALKKSVEGILKKEPLDIVKKAEEKADKPFVILFFGFNGTGKTLTIGKFAKMLKAAGLNSVMAAGDTFRAAAIEQLEIHAKNLDVPIIKQKRGADSAAVIYDAVNHAKARGIEVVLADTAGRSNTNVNLMDELKKVVRVNKPDLKIFVGDALTGNDAADQAKMFHDAVGIDAAVLTKVDCDAKGGSCLSVSYMTNAPIIYLGTGQGYDDMREFNPEWFLSKVF